MAVVPAKQHITLAHEGVGRGTRRVERWTRRHVVEDQVSLGNRSHGHSHRRRNRTVEKLTKGGLAAVGATSGV